MFSLRRKKNPFFFSAYEKLVILSHYAQWFYDIWIYRCRYRPPTHNPKTTRYLFNFVCERFWIRQNAYIRTPANCLLASFSNIFTEMLPFVFPNDYKRFFFLSLRFPPPKLDQKCQRRHVWDGVECRLNALYLVWYCDAMPIMSVCVWPRMMCKMNYM